METRRLEWIDQHLLPFAEPAGRVLITALMVWLAIGLLMAVKRAAPTGAITLATSAKMLIVAATMAFFSSFIWLFGFNTLGSTLRAELMGSAIGDDVQTHESPRLARVASLIAGRRATVRCSSRDDWTEHEQEAIRNTNARELWGYVTWELPAPVIHLSPQVCAGLNPLLNKNVSVEVAKSLEPLAVSVTTLAHEATHVSGVRDEPKTECFAIQTIRRTMMLLGRTSEEGQMLATFVWKDFYPRRNAGYRSPECRDGGRFDRHRNTSAWP